VRKRTAKPSKDSKKIMTAPVKPHIYKMLRRDYQYEGLLELNKRMHLFIHTNTKAIKRYFLIPRDDMKTITVLMPYASEEKVYSIIRGFEREFREKLHLYVAAQVQARKPALEAVRCFLERYDISFEEYDYMTAYKSWQRFTVCEKKKENLRLWL
jgi:hypothetical protein